MTPRVSAQQLKAGCTMGSVQSAGACATTPTECVSGPLHMPQQYTAPMDISAATAGPSARYRLNESPSRTQSSFRHPGGMYHGCEAATAAAEVDENEEEEEEEEEENRRRHALIAIFTGEGGAQISAN